MTFNSYNRQPGWRVGAMITAVIASGALAAPTAWATVDVPIRAGQVVFTDSTVRTKELTHGTGVTEFSLRLPDGAVCPGDSANDQWRVQSFMIPTSDDPTAIRYGAIGPEPPTIDRSSLFMLDTRPFVHQLTRRNMVQGEPGIISVLPGFSLSVQAGEATPSGTYRIGIACTYFGTTALYWDTEIELTASLDGRADSLTWRLATVSDTVFASDTASGSSAIPAVFGALAVLLLGVVLWKRRSRQATHIKRPAMPVRNPKVTQTATRSKETQ